MAVPQTVPYGLIVYIYPLESGAKNRYDGLNKLQI